MRSDRSRWQTFHNGCDVPYLYSCYSHELTDRYLQEKQWHSTDDQEYQIRYQEYTYKSATVNVSDLADVFLG